jgi:hypothetical protein
VNRSGAAPVVVDSVFVDNTSRGMECDESRLVIRGCTFDNNGSVGAESYLCEVQIVDSSFRRHSFAGVANRFGRLSANNSTFSGNGSYGIRNTDSDIEVTNCTFLDTRGSGVSSKGDSAIVTGCEFRDIEGLGLSLDTIAPAVVQNCRFVNAGASFERPASVSNSMFVAGKGLSGPRRTPSPFHSAFSSMCMRLTAKAR